MPDLLRVGCIYALFPRRHQSIFFLGWPLAELRIDDIGFTLGRSSSAKFSWTVPFGEVKQVLVEGVAIVKANGTSGRVRISQGAKQRVIAALDERRIHFDEVTESTYWKVRADPDR